MSAIHCSKIVAEGVPKGHNGWKLSEWMEYKKYSSESVKNYVSCLGKFLKYFEKDKIYDINSYLVFSYVLFCRQGIKWNHSFEPQKPSIHPDCLILSQYTK